ncbi:MAG TPA: LuxR C-terminal-related transcriptional regulator [Ktedonobacteraceae bacterium]|nr:LuxR C-terminal-related transcriptional regulator [Ktedonobacteraceae bacterium]
MRDEQKEHVLLTTKFTAPLFYFKKTLTRTRLHERLSAGSNSPFTLVTAPAGSGKTTIVCEWLQQKQIEAAWLSLDERDNDPERFWQYVLAALQKRVPHLGQRAITQIVQADQDSRQTMLICLLNDLALLAEDIVFVLDGYHVITNAAIHADLIFLLEQSPSSFHLVMTTRLVPPFPLARMHVRGLVTELTANDLCFTLEESAIFLTQSMGLTLSAAEIETLHTYTEGWIAGMQLIALSLQSRSAGVNLPSFIQQLAGNQWHVFHYLIDEVFSSLPADAQEFILCTSILKHMNSSLCDAVTLQQNGREMLEYFQQANLFVLALDERGEWYRYYQIFANLLYYYLQSRSPELVPTLHLRASYWFEQHDQIVDAVTHACAAKSFERAATLIESSGWSLMQRGESDIVFSLLKMLPKELLSARPYLAYIYALVFFYLGDFVECERAIYQLKQATQDEQDPLLLSRVFELRAYFALSCGDSEGAITSAQQVLALLPADERLLRGSALVALGAGYTLYGDLALAVQFLRQGQRHCQEMQHFIGMQLAAIYLGIAQYARGRLREAEQALLCLVRDSDTSWYKVALFFLLARIYNEWNEAEQAEEFYRQGMRFAGQSGHLEMLTEGHLCGMLLAMRRGDREQGKRLLDTTLLNMQHIAERPALLARVIEMHVYCWLAQRNVARAAHYCELYMPSVQSMPADVRAVWYCTKARVLIAQGEVQQAHALLQEVLVEMQAQGRVHAQIEVGVLLVQAYQAEGSLSEALAYLEKTLLLAEPNGYTSIFVQAGSEMAHLLSDLCVRYQRFSARDVPAFSSNYLCALLAAFGPDEAARARKMLQEKTLAQSMLVEKLSERELEVLQQIAAGSTNNEIAQKLVVTVSTIKTHINNIYAKLQVHTRLQAVRKAQDLGLIGHPEPSTHSGALIFSPEMFVIRNNTPSFLTAAESWGPF